MMPTFRCIDHGMRLEVIQRDNGRIRRRAHIPGPKRVSGPGHAECALLRAPVVTAGPLPQVDVFGNPTGQYCRIEEG